MPLFDKNRPTINQKRFAKNLSSTPFEYTETPTKADIKFENAKPSDDNWNLIKHVVVENTDKEINICNHPSISSGRVIRFFIGEPELLDLPGTPGSGFGDCIIDPESFLQNNDCIVTYLFGHIVPKRRSSYGFRTDPPIPTSEIPFSPPEGDIQPDDTEMPYQVVFVEQDYIDNEMIKVSSLNIRNNVASTGISVIKNETLDIDTWYNSNFESYNIGNNVSSGYLNDTHFDWDVGDRYNWTHGSMFFSLNVSTEHTSGSVFEYQPYEIVDFTENGVEIKSEASEDTIKLISWKFFVYSIGTDDDPYKDDKHNFDFKSTDADLVSDLHINYFNRRYDKAIMVNKIKTIKSGENIIINRNNRGNIVIARK